MDARRKKELRSLIHTLPELIKSHLVNQAFETEKVIATTFELSEPFQGLMNNIPQNHIEKIADWYSKLSFKAFQGGLNNAREKLQTIDKPTGEGEELDEAIKVKIPMPYTLSQHLTKTFQDHVGSFLQTVPNSNDIFVQFKQDIESAYREGVKEYLSSIEEKEEEEIEETLDDSHIDDEEQRESEEEAESEEAESEGDEAKMEYEEEDEEEDEAYKEHDDYENEENEEHEESEEIDEFVDEKVEEVADALDDKSEEQAFLEEWLGEIEAMPSDKRQKRNDPIDKPIEGGVRNMGAKKSKVKKDPILADVSENEILRALEEYTRIPGDSQAEMVLRYELGLPPKKAQAEAEEVEARVPPRRKAMASVRRRTVRGGKVIGPYDTQALKQKILSAVKTHSIDDNDLQTIVIDSVVANIDEMSKEEAAQAIASKMDMTEALASEITLEEVKAKVDALAMKLTNSLGLPGDIVFVDADGDYLMTFAFDRNDAKDLGVMAGNETVAARSAKSRPLPKGPQGVLSRFEQDQIEKLAALSKKKTLKDIRKASAKVAAYLSDVLKNMRTGKLGLAEGTSKLRQNMASVIGEVFGLDGQGYYEYLTKSKKRA